jgi:hypothetical protein
LFRKASFVITTENGDSTFKASPLYYANMALGNSVENVDEETHPHAPVIWMTNIICHNDASVLPAGIDEMKANRQNGRNIRYNLAGQRVGNDYKGLVLMNGKKMVMK